MCGIAGGFHHSLSPADAQPLLHALAHRGPDHQGIWHGPGVWLANTRLAIQDLSDAGNQPMLSADGRHCIVYNGELYNAPALREALQKKGLSFRSHCDTEVLLSAFAAWGAECLERLEGDFAFAVWDEKKQQLFLARDPMGVKPLYLYQKGDTLLFASEIGALLAIEGLDKSLHAEAFAAYLTFLYNPSEATPFRHIRKLLPGHFLQLDFGKSPGVAQRYYRIPMPAEAAPNRDWRRELSDTLRGVVMRQLHADVPVGIMLSGGLDSSLIAALAAKSARPLQAFCIHTGDTLSAEGFDDDVPFARMAARHLGLPLQEISGGLQPSGAWIDEMVRTLGEPQDDPAAWYNKRIAEAAHEAGVKVLLSGAGGDDLFSGYRRHQAITAFRSLRLLPRKTAALAGLFPQKSASLRRLGKLLSGAGQAPLQAAINSHFWTPPQLLAQLLSFTPGNPASLLESLLNEIPNEHRLLQQMLFLEQRSFLPHHNLAYTDKMCMAHSVEARVPFADRALANLAAAMPPELKLRGQTTKWLLREIARPLLPSEIIERRKTGFGAPLRQWMRGPLQPLLRERLLDDAFQSRGFFNRQGIEKLIVQQAAGKTDAAYTLFSLLCIESWLRQFAAPA
jgi:asparagine synthase (glutamine-hydrolysing)